MLTRIGLIQIHALFNKILIKNIIIHKIAVEDNILCRRIFIFTSFFVLNKVPILPRLAGLMRLHGQI